MPRETGDSGSCAWTARPIIAASTLAISSMATLANSDEIRMACAGMSCFARPKTKKFPSIYFHFRYAMHQPVPIRKVVQRDENQPHPSRPHLHRRIVLYRRPDLAGACV
jgi:hypothetical protein